MVSIDVFNIRQGQSYIGISVFITDIFSWFSPPSNKVFIRMAVYSYSDIINSL